MKAKLEVNKADFQKVVDDLESKQTFSNPSHLWQAVEETAWAKTHKPRPLKVSMCRQRAKELGIAMKTVASKREMTKERIDAMKAARKNRKSRGDKMKNFGESFILMQREVPSRFLHLVSQAEAGSLRASLKLKCLDCTCYQPTEIKECTLTGCPLFPHRPYQKRCDDEETKRHESYTYTGTPCEMNGET